MKIYDCFPFFNELEVLELRLRMHYPYVDHFVICESKETFMGQKKPLYFKDNIQRYQKFLDKIIHVVVEVMPASDDPWVKEEFQKDQVRVGVANAADDDLLLICDVDELLRPEAINQAGNFDGFTAFDMPMYQFYLNLCERKAGWDAAYAIKKHMLPEIENLSRARFGRSFTKESAFIDRCQTVHNAGWHFTHLGGADMVRHKYHAYSHSNGHFPRVIRQGNFLEEHIAIGGIVGNCKDRCEYVPFDDSYPKEILDNISYYNDKGYIGNIFKSFSLLQEKYYQLRNDYAFCNILDQTPRASLYNLPPEEFLSLAGVEPPYPRLDEARQPFRGKLIGPGKPATQSSICEWSLGKTKEEDARGALVGGKNGLANFHTARELNPWWQIDLLEPKAITGICIFNRLSPTVAAERAKKLIIELGNENAEFRVVYRRCERNVFGGIDGHPLEIEFDPPELARYVKLSLPGVNELHLDHVEIYSL